MENRSNTVNPEQCNECALKQKYVSGTSSKCLKHMFEERQKEMFDQQVTLHEEIIGDLQNIQSLLPDYFVQLSLISSSHQSSLQISQILEEIDKIKDTLKKAMDHKIQSQTSLGNFSIHQPFKSIGKMPRTSNTSTFDLKQEQVGAFLIQNDLMNQYIQDWVSYFAEKLILPNKKKTFIQQVSLPLEQNQEMKIFKGKINQKYEDFLKKIQQKDKLLNEAINKLAQYVDVKERKGKRSNSVFDLSSKLRGKLTDSLTPMKELNLSRAQSGQSTTREKLKARQVNPFKASTSSFVIDNVSAIFTNLEVPNQKLEETYLMLSCQAQCIEDLLQQCGNESFLL